jgi:hypothetical protein
LSSIAISTKSKCWSKSKCWGGSQLSKLPLHASHVALPTW